MSKLSELIGNLHERPNKPIEFPGREDVMLRLWCLTQHEELLARKAAYEFVTKELGFTAVDLAYDEERAVDDALMGEVLARALRDHESPVEPFAENAKELREKLSTGDIQALWNEYLIYARERSVLKDVEDVEKEFDELLEKVRQGFPLATRLSRYASPLLRILLLTAIDRCANGISQSVSDGLLPNESGKTSSEA